jgi:outer membrane immunogenic protein
MKKLFLASTAFLALAAGSAVAADLPVAYKAPAPMRPACAQFGGVYLGANVGAGYATAHRNDDDGYFIDNAGHSMNGSGWNGGVQLGYNWQRGCTVFGVEADWSWSSAKTSFVDNPNFPAFSGVLDTNLKSFGTARTRTGIIVDDVMLYVTGGFAWGNVNNTYTRTFGGPFEQFEFSSTRWGWTVGAGSEWKFASNWSLKSEVLYMQFKQQQETFFSPINAANFRFSNNDSVVVARMGVNYIFNTGAY